MALVQANRSFHAWLFAQLLLLGTHTHAQAHTRLGVSGDKMAGLCMPTCKKRRCQKQGLTSFISAEHQSSLTEMSLLHSVLLCFFFPPSSRYLEDISINVSTAVRVHCGFTWRKNTGVPHGVLDHNVCERVWKRYRFMSAWIVDTGSHIIKKFSVILIVASFVVKAQLHSPPGSAPRPRQTLRQTWS